MPLIEREDSLLVVIDLQPGFGATASMPMTCGALGKLPPARHGSRVWQAPWASPL